MHITEKFTRRYVTSEQFVNLMSKISFWTYYVIKHFKQVITFFWRSIWKTWTNDFFSKTYHDKSKYKLKTLNIFGTTVQTYLELVTSSLSERKKNLVKTVEKNCCAILRLIELERRKHEHLQSQSKRFKTKKKL